jgi:hypothetical protein
MFIYFELSLIFKQEGFEKSKNLGSENNEELIALTILKTDLYNNPDVKLIDDIEIKYHGKMYDISRRTENETAVTFYCYSDEKEDILNITLNKYISENTKPSNSNNPIGNILNHLITICCISSLNTDTYIQKDFLPVAITKCHVLQSYPEIPTPPPRNQA